MQKKIEMFSPKEKIWRGLVLTDAAAIQIKNLVKNDPDMLGLRVSVKKTGCAGFGYKMEKAIQLVDGDQVYEHNGAKLYVPLQAMPFIDGTELDYVRQGLNHVFKFKNPKAQHACGCGESFSL